MKTQPSCDQRVYPQFTIQLALFSLSPVVDCGALMNPDNGRVDTPQGTTLNRLATYSCNCGYCLVGDETRTCQANGQWSGSEPTCNSLSIPAGMGVYQCPTMSYWVNFCVTTFSLAKYIDCCILVCGVCTVTDLCLQLILYK